jgi:hypothetical protein
VADLGQLETALRNADAAGDIEAARAFAGEILKARMSAPAQPEGPGPSTMEGMPGMPIQAGMGLGNELRGGARNLDKFARMAANGMTFGLADKFAGGMDALTGQAPSYDAGVKAQRAETEKVRQEQPGLATVGELTGGLAGGVGLAKSGLTLAGRVGPNLIPRAGAGLVEGGLYGGAHGAGNTYSDKAKDYIDAAKKGAAWGAGIGAGLPVAGTIAGNAYRLGSAFLGPRVEGTSRGASALLRTAAMADEQGIRNLPSMGPEAMLVDAGPAMKGLGQGAGTGTGQGRTELVNALAGRDSGTGGRLAQALDSNLGPAPVPSRVEAGFRADRKALSPEYEAAFDKANAVDTPRIVDALDSMIPNVRGEARRVLMSIRDDLHITDAQGVTAHADPYPRTLFAVRNSIDGMSKSTTDSNVQRVLGDVRKIVDGELAAKVPGIKAADAKYAQSKQQSEALERGQAIFDTGRKAIRPVELKDDVAKRGLWEVEALRKGARAELDRVVGTNVNDLTALERKIATPQDWNYQKMQTMFGDAPTARVAKALLDNRTFRQSYQDIVQNSQTAQRMQAAGSMDGAAGGNIPTDTTLTGIGLKAVRLVAKALSGASSETTKDEIGRVLASQGPRVQQLAQQLLASAQQSARTSDTLSRVIGSSRWAPGATAYDSGNRK